MCSINRIEKESTFFICFFIFVLVLPVAAFSSEKNGTKNEDLFIYKSIVENRVLIYSKPMYEWYQVSEELPVTVILGQDVEASLIALYRSERSFSMHILAHLSLISLDGVLGETYACLVLSKGKGILPYLKKAKNMAEKNQCFLPEYRKYKRNICYAKDDAVKKIDFLINGIQKNIGTENNCF